MPSQWMDSSEICVGLAIKNRINPNVINVLDVYPPYNEIITMIRNEKTIDDITISCGIGAVTACLSAVDRVNGDIDPLKWLSVLEKSASRERVSIDLERISKDIKDGKDVDAGRIMKAAGMLETGMRELTPLSEIEPQKFKFVKTGYEPIDKHVGGLPDSCVTIIGASPGVGKSSLALSILSKMVGEHKKKKAAFFSLEMTMNQIARRYLELDPKMTKEQKSRILLGDSSYTVHEIYAIASKVASQENLCVIGIDYADMLVEGEQSEALMGVIYRNLSMLAKKTGVPVLLISQLNRQVYIGGIPRVNHLRYSSMAEATARLILLPYNPTAIWSDSGGKESQLVSVEGRGYIIVGKSNFGFKEGGPGAISVEWDGASGWGDKSFGYTRINH